MNTPQTPASRQEGLKLFYEVFKHLTTLSSGSVVVLVTFHEKLNQPSWRPLMSMSFLGFTIATVGSIIVMLSTARTIRRNEQTDQLPDKTGNVGYRITAVGFAVGIISLCLFGMRNL
jgi:hypothetical protein